MLLGPRTPNPWRSQRPISIISRRLRSKLKFSYFSLAKVPVVCENALQPLDDDCNEFLPWLERKAGVEISSSLSIGKSAHGRSLFASKSIQTGDCILKVPFNVQISPENLPPEVKNSLGNEVGDLAKCAVLILHEQKMGQDSEWSPYICCFPHPGELHSTIFWSEKELNMIRQSSVYQETISQKNKIKKEFLTLKPALECFPDIFASICFERFMHAYAIVGSRAWESIKGVSLIPFADFFNHDGLSESIVLIDEHRQLSEVIADRDYAPGEEVLISYGKFPNAVLLLDFGFTLPHNIHDQVQIQISLPPDDPLREMKLDLMQNHCMPAVKPVNGFDSLVYSFTIKEVKSAVGKGKGGLPQSLRAFSRVLNCSSMQELCDLAREAAQCDGRLARRPFKTRGREILAHQILLSQITHLIEEHESSIELLGPADSSSSCGNFVLRSQMARDLLTGELRVLKSAYRWLNNYIGLLEA